MNPVFIDDQFIFCYDQSYHGDFSLLLLNIKNYQSTRLLSFLMPMGVYAYNHKAEELYILINSTDFRETASAEQSIYIASSGELYVLTADWEALKQKLK
jgi:hypothetical protein